MIIEHWMFTLGADSKDHFNRTPLMFAAAGGLPDTVQSLIDNGADVNTTTKVGGTALIYAAAMGCLEAAILKGANGIILAHNHPSGDPAPSKDDISLTHRLREAGHMLGIDVMDHVIVAPPGGSVSMKELGIV